jgi:hypothetical protein
MQSSETGLQKQEQGIFLNFQAKTGSRSAGDRCELEIPL